MLQNETVLRSGFAANVNKYKSLQLFMIIFLLFISGVAFASLNENLKNIQNIGPMGGRITGLAASTDNPRVILAGTSVNGIYISKNGGESWASVNTGINNSRDVWGLGYFKGNFYSAVGGRVYTFNQISNQWVPVPYFQNTLTSQVYTDGYRLYMLDQMHLYISSNGINWALKPFNSLNTIYSITTNNQNTIYLGSVDDILKSIDGGKTFNKIPIVNFKPSIKWHEVTSIAVNGNIMLAAIETGSQCEPSIYTLYFSTDAGVHWKNISAKFPQVSIFSDTQIHNNVIYVGTNRGVYKSQDDGKTWTQSYNDEGLYTINSLVFSKANIYASTNNNGVLLNHFGTNKWCFINKGLINGYILNMSLSNGKIYVTDKFSDVRGSDIPKYIFLYNPTNQTWRLLKSPPYFDVNDLSSVGHILFSRNDDLINPSGGFYKSLDDGMHWQKISINGNNSLSGDASNGFVYAFGNNNLGRPFIYVSYDAGVTWKALGTQGLQNAILTEAKLYNLNGTLFIYSGYADSIYFSTNNGITWNRSTLLSASSMFAIGSTFFAVNGYLYKSIDSGKSWSQVNTMRALPSNVGDVVSNGKDIFLLGMRDAVSPTYIIAKSSDLGKHWSVLYNYTASNVYLTNFTPNKIAVMSNYLYIGTQGYGVFRLALTKAFNKYS